MQPNLNRQVTARKTPHHSSIKPAYRTKNGQCFIASVEEFLRSDNAQQIAGKVDLILTSPPFPLTSPKKYGNKQGSEYLQWLVHIVSELLPLLRNTGSLVIEIGNSWNKGQPTMSTLPLKTLLSIAEIDGISLCQQFVWENSARLPGPATWVNRERIRIKDSHTNIWWFSPTPFPKADNRNVLTEYSPAMKRLIKTGQYNPGRRPSEHVLGVDTFRVDNHGAIPGSTLIMGNTSTDPDYRNWCRKRHLSLHPARMPIRLAEFFVKFLTSKGDLVLDPFSGSNTTGKAAENLGRRWIGVEQDPKYVEGSHGRFQ
jgi:site-specific DNA-methyltransferase (cytosine-N4-specific)